MSHIVGHITDQTYKLDSKSFGVDSLPAIKTQVTSTGKNMVYTVQSPEIMMVARTGGKTSRKLDNIRLGTSLIQAYRSMGRKW